MHKEKRKVDSSSLHAHTLIKQSNNGLPGRNDNIDCLHETAVVHAINQCQKSKLARIKVRMS